MNPLKRVALAYLLAPMLFIALMNLNSHASGRPRHTEWSLDIALYVVSAFHLLVPLFATVAAALLVQSTAMRNVIGVTGFLALFPVAQVAALISVGDALSDPLPDDPPYLERLQLSIEGWSTEAQMAFGVAVPIAIWLLISAWRQQSSH